MGNPLFSCRVRSGGNYLVFVASRWRPESIFVGSLILVANFFLWDDETILNPSVNQSLTTTLKLEQKMGSCLLPPARTRTTIQRDWK